MTALLLAVFVASVVGSLHCAGMCGPLLACAVADPNQTTTPQHTATLGSGFGRKARWSSWLKTTKPLLAYHLGRLASYAALGAAAGGVGALLDLGGVLANIQPAAAAVAGVTMIVIGVLTLTHAMQRVSRHIKLPKKWIALVTATQRRAMRFPPTARAAMIGLGSTLLPCGWLYAFAITAAGTGSVAWGTAVMAVFWVGTLPLMTALGLGLQGVLGFAGKKLPLATGAMMILVGLFTLTNRMNLDPALVMSAAQTHATHASSVPSTTEEPACCALGEATKIPADTGHPHDH